MVFGKSKEEKAQDARIKQLQKGISDCWSWIQYHEKNMKIMIPNNNKFIEKNKAQAVLNKQLTASVNALIEKDKQHDKKDAEHDTLIQNLKNLGKALETATTTTE